MAITSLATLRTAVQNWTHRSSLSTDRIDEALTFAEARMARELRVRDMESDASVSITSGTRTAALPTNYRGLKRIYLDTSPIASLEYVTPENYWRKWMSSTTGQPVAYTIEAENFVFGPVPESAYTAKVLSLGLAALTGSVVPALLTNNPDLYLYGTLVHVAPFTGNSRRIAEWNGLYESASNSVKASDLKDRHGAGVLVMRPEIAGP